MTVYYVTWPFGERETTEQDAIAEGSPHVANVPIRSMVLMNTAQGAFKGYPGFQVHDLTICAEAEQQDAARILSGPEPLVFLRQGANTCWVDAMATAMRMHGLGRLAYDASDTPEPATTTSLALDLLRADWSKFKKAEDFDRYRTPILAKIATLSPQLKIGSMGNPGDFWQYATRGLPSVSFNTIKKKLCTSCDQATYYQTLQDTEVRSIEIYNPTKPTDTLPEALNAHFKERVIPRHKTGFSTCTHCHTELPLVQKTVMIDRPPYVLCLGLNTAEKSSLPNLEDPKTVLNGMSLKFEHISGDERSVRYKTVALVYSSGQNHWVVAVNVKYKKTSTAKDVKEGWLECDGLEASSREVNGRTLNHKIRSGEVARVLLKRVYKERDQGVFLR